MHTRCFLQNQFPRSLGRFLRQAELDYAPRHLSRTPSRTLAKIFRNVKLNHLCHNQSPLLHCPNFDLCRRKPLLGEKVSALSELLASEFPCAINDLLPQPQSSAMAERANIEHVAATSGDVLKAQIASLRRLFPEVFVEGNRATQNQKRRTGVSDPHGKTHASPHCDYS